MWYREFGTQALDQSPQLPAALGPVCVLHVTHEAGATLVTHGPDHRAPWAIMFDTDLSECSPALQ